MINILETSREFNEVETYLLTISPNIKSCKDADDGEKITIDGFLIFEDVKDDVHYFKEFVLDLIRSTENVGIVLSKATHASQTMKFATLFVAIYCSKLSETQRQFAIASRECFEDFAVVRTVHRFKQVFFAFFRSMNWLE